MAEPCTLYKLIILYMLDRVDFPLTNSQISSFLLDRGYTNYFTLQQAFSELEEANLVKPQTIRNTASRMQSKRKPISIFRNTRLSCEMRFRSRRIITVPRQKNMPYTVS